MPNLFSDRRKAFTTIGCLLIGLATLGTIIYDIMYTVGQRPADEEPAPSVSEPAEETEGIGLEEAREIALADAGLDASQVSFYQETLVAADGPQAQLYQFKFKSWNVRYEYQINAQTGAVYSKVKEITATPAPSFAPKPTPTPEPSAAPPEETASQPVESTPPAESTPVPDSAPPDPSPAPAPSQEFTSMYIGMNRAKTIALEHAELSAAQVRFTHVGMDRENGRMVYELEFRRGSVEYEYEIDAETGRIVSFERDKD